VGTFKYVQLVNAMLDIEDNVIIDIKHIY
jgi:hypothetical protein